MNIPLLYRKEEAHIRRQFPHLPDHIIRKESQRLKKQHQEYLEYLNSESTKETVTPVGKS